MILWRVFKTLSGGLEPAHADTIHLEADYVYYTLTMAPVLEDDKLMVIPFISHESNPEPEVDAERAFRAADIDVAPGLGLVASSTAFRDAIACSCVAFSSTLPTKERSKCTRQYRPCIVGAPTEHMRCNPFIIDHIFNVTSATTVFVFGNMSINIA